MKKTNYYRFDNNLNLIQISENDEIIERFENEVLDRPKALKIEILPVDFKISPCNKPPKKYAEPVRKTVTVPTTEKGAYQEVLFRLNKESKNYFEEYDNKNDPRNRINVSEEIFNKWKRGKRSST